MQGTGRFGALQCFVICGILKGHAERIATLCVSYLPVHDGGPNMPFTDLKSIVTLA
jgi:hypothetical protein